MGHAATVSHLEGLLERCHPSNRPAMRARLLDARRGEGPTLFDEIIEIIADHGPGGTQAEDGVDLELA